MHFFKGIKEDFISSIVVFLVAVPLCLGIALASNAPLFSGILAGIIGGIIVGFLSQSQVSVSGPAAGMIAVVIASVTELGSFSLFLTALMLAGVLQMIMGKCRLGFIADFVPTNVIQGLLCAIGILIIIKQLPFAFGFFAKPQMILNELKQSQLSWQFSALQTLTNHISLGALIISTLSIALLFSWNKLAEGVSQYLPGPVIVVVAGVLANYLFQAYFPGLHLASREHLVTLPQVQKLFEFKNYLQFPELNGLMQYKVYFYAILIALVASIETLLNLEAAEKIDKRKRYCSRNRELLAQGFGNTLSGLIGGLPITSVIVRSSVNVQTGGRTKKATMLHGVWLLMSVLLIPHWMNNIPLASLAAILIYVGLKLANINVFKSIYQRGLENFIPFVTTVVMIISTNLLTGVLCGLLVSAFLVMKYNSKPNFEMHKEVYPSGEVIRITLPQHATFLNKAALIASLRELPHGTQVILDGRQTLHMDFDIVEVIADFSKNLSSEKNISLRTEGFDESPKVPRREDFSNVTTLGVQMKLDFADVLAVLKAGNLRFKKNRPINRDMPKLVENTAESQHPFAVILSCIDSRVPVELIFDMTVGDLFVTRIAGNVATKGVIESIEYATAIAKAKLVVVMGHTGCGAVHAACQKDHREVMPALLNHLNPAIESVSKSDVRADDFELAVIKENILMTKEKLYQQSALLKQLSDDGDIGIVGAIYDIKTGHVSFENMEQLLGQPVFPAVAANE